MCYENESRIRQKEAGFYKLTSKCDVSFALDFQATFMVAQL